MENNKPLDATLHQPVRTLIAAYLAGRGQATFSELKRELSLTDGNLDAHLKKLVDGGYLATRRDDSVARVQTVFALTEAGRVALRDYFEQLARLQQFAAAGAATADERDTFEPGGAPA